MRARYHGEVATSQEGTQFRAAAAQVPKRPTVGFMFGELADDPANRLPEGTATVGALILLGQAMAEDSSRV